MKNKPEIGIVTFCFTRDNYGQLLQCYALQQALIKVGCAPFLIRNSGKLYIEKTKKQKLYSLLKVIFFLKISLLRQYVSNRIELHRNKKLERKKLKLEKIDRSFDEFRKKHIRSTDRSYMLSELIVNPPHADYYVCGSDQIWSGYNELYFLEWVDSSVPRISYAASFGSKNIGDDFALRISDSLKRFKVVTVREENGIEICRKAGRKDAVCVPDPTLLLTGRDYEKLISGYQSVSGGKDYIMVYLLGWETDIDFDSIENFAKQKGLDLVYVPSIGDNDIKCYNRRWKKTYPSAEEWLRLISNAEYVITNSFHGTVFSMIFNKRFGVYLIAGKSACMNDRLFSLLRNFDLNDRIVSNDLQILDKIIDYKKVNDMLEIERNRISGFFRTWFGL